MPGIIALFSSDGDAERAYDELGSELAGGYCLIRGIPERGNAESNRNGLTAAMAGDQVVDSATVGLFTLNPGDHVISDPWDEEFGLEYNPGAPLEEVPEQPMVTVRGDFPGLADGGIELTDRVIARIPAAADEREKIAGWLAEGKPVVWARVEGHEAEGVRGLLQQAGSDSLIETNG